MTARCNQKWYAYQKKWYYHFWEKRGGSEPTGSSVSDPGAEKRMFDEACRVCSGKPVRNLVLMNVGLRGGGRVVQKTKILSRNDDLGPQLRVNVAQDGMSKRMFNQNWQIPLSIPLPNTTEL